MHIWFSFALTGIYFTTLGFLSFFLGELMPKKWLHPCRFPFSARKWERNGKFYDRFGIRRWKDVVPDMSRLFKKHTVPKRFGKCPNSQECATLAVETCRAEAVHAILCIFAVPVVFFWEDRLVGIVAMLIDILANLSFIMIQRYNRPALIALEKRLLVREQHRAEKAACRKGDIS